MVMEEGEELEEVGVPGALEEEEERIPPERELVAGLVTGAGRPGDRFPGWFCQQFVLGVIFEAIDYEAVRANAYRYGLIFPDWGRTPLGPERFVRFNDEFWMMPIVWMDRQIAWQIVGEPGEEKLEPRAILHPRWVRDLPGDRRWILWAKYGPLHEALTAEGRAALRRQFPNFHIRPDYDYSLIDDPWDPSANELFWVMNPELKGRNVVDMSSEEFRQAAKKERTEWERTEWTYMNGPLQDAWCDYLALLVSGRAFEDPRSWDPYKTSVDFHANERFCTEFNFIVNVELDDCGIPIYERTDGFYKPKLLEKPRLQKLITSPNKAGTRYLETKGYERLDFDPRHNKYRDLWGRYYSRRDPEHGIVSDRERMAQKVHKFIREREYEIEPDTGKKTFLAKLLTVLHLKREPKGEVVKEIETVKVKGPTHSAVDLVAELPAEDWVKIGKFLRHNKLRWRHYRLYNVGVESKATLEADVGHWMMTWVPVIHQHGLNDAELYLPFQDFWMSVMDADKGIINGFVWAEYPFDEYRKLVRRTPLPTPPEQMFPRLAYWKFDPEHCWYGLDQEGRPRLPVAMLGRLAKSPTEGGMNMVCSDGRTVLTTYRERQVGEEAIRDMCRLSAAEWENFSTEEKDLYTLGYAYYRPIEVAGDYHKGLLSELWRNQPANPLIQRLREVWNTQVRKKTVHIRPFYYKEVVDGLPEEVIESLRPFLEELNKKSDRRVRLWAAFQSHGRRGGVRGFLVGAAVRFCEEGYGTDNGLSKEEQQGRQADLCMLAWLNSQFDRAVFLARGICYYIANNVDILKQYELVGSAIAAGLHPQIAHVVAEGLTQGRFIKWNLLLPRDLPEPVQYVEKVFAQVEIDRLGEEAIKEIVEGRMQIALESTV